MSLTRAWRNTRQLINRYLLQNSYTPIFFRCLVFKARTNMHGNSKTSNETNSSTSPKTPDKEDVANKKETRDASSETTEREVPENFSEMERQIFIAHKNAIEANCDTYVDPLTGFDVFTRETLLNRGKCCGNACRHCPYGHVNVPEHLRTKTFNSHLYT